MIQSSGSMNARLFESLLLMNQLLGLRQQRIEWVFVQSAAQKNRGRFRIASVVCRQRCIAVRRFLFELCPPIVQRLSIHSPRFLVAAELMQTVYRLKTTGIVGRVEFSGGLIRRQRLGIVAAVRTGLVHARQLMVPIRAGGV